MKKITQEQAAKKLDALKERAERLSAQQWKLEEELEQLMSRVKASELTEVSSDITICDLMS